MSMPCCRAAYAACITKKSSLTRSARYAGCLSTAVWSSSPTVCASTRIGEYRKRSAPNRSVCRSTRTDCSNGKTSSRGSLRSSPPWEALPTSFCLRQEKTAGSLPAAVVERQFRSYLELHAGVRIQVAAQRVVCADKGVVVTRCIGALRVVAVGDDRWSLVPKIVHADAKVNASGRDRHGQRHVYIRIS